MAVSHNYYKWAKANEKLYSFMAGNCILDEEEEFMHLLN